MVRLVDVGACVLGPCKITYTREKESQLSWFTVTLPLDARFMSTSMCSAAPLATSTCVRILRKGTLRVSVSPSPSHILATFLRFRAYVRQLLGAPPLTMAMPSLPVLLGPIETSSALVSVVELQQCLCDSALVIGANVHGFYPFCTGNGSNERRMVASLGLLEAHDECYGSLRYKGWGCRLFFKRPTHMDALSVGFSQALLSMKDAGPSP
ncbi:hypothetical protein VNO77_21767 [Canavalia gladiata]|uniref:Uncharacterized protein n=1 Tax=Canavalia gladiata TaxID=3824 RepID=A0AAN9Q7G1_CANGL